MIGVLSKHLDTNFVEKLSDKIIFIKEHNLNVTKGINGLFIDWVPKISDNEGAWMFQASLLQNHIKTGIPIVIFDRYFSLTEKEVDWVKKFNTYLFEPALNSGRIGFDYLPEWINNFDIVLDKEDEEDRVYDLVYSHHKLEYNIKEFEKWFKDYARLFPDKSVAYSSFVMTEFKKEEFKKDGLVFLEQRHPIYSEGHLTVAIDSKKSYEIGYFDPMYFFAMNLGCLPLLPIDHKYFHSMFQGLVIKDIKDMDYYVSSFGKVKDVCIEEIFERIKTQWNEFTIDHAADVVRACYE